MKKKNAVHSPDNRLIGYARVSTEEQNLDMQIDALLRAGVMKDNLHVEKISAVAKRRPKLELALMDARHGDTLVVWKLDRLGRNVVDLHTQVQALEKRGVQFQSLQEKIDTTSAIGKAFFGLLAVFAQFERDMVVERTKHGLDAARARGFVPGAKRQVNLEKARKMLRSKTVREVAEHFGVTPNAIRRYFTHGELDKIRNGDV